MKAFVINLDRCPDRLNDFKASWDQSFVSRSPFGYDVFRAFDGQRMKLPVCWKNGPGGYGLMLSFLTIFTKVLHDNLDEPFLVFEDDAYFHQDWFDEVELALKEMPSEWHYLNLGPHVGEAGYINPSPVSSRVCRLHHAWRLHGVVYNPATLHELIYQIGSLPWTTDQVYNDYMIRGCESFYATSKTLVGQRAGASTITNHTWPAFTGRLGLGNPIHECLK